MKQRIICIILIICIFSFTACSGKKDKGDDMRIPRDTQKQAFDPVTNEDSRESQEEKVNSPENKDTGTIIPTEKAVETSTKPVETSSKPVVPENVRQELGSEGEGVITYMDGNVDLVRNGSSMADDLEEGFELQNYDLVSTGEGSSAEIEVYSSRCPESSITIMENTIFSFEINKLEAMEMTTFDVLAGSISLKVDAITRDKGLDVTTGEATMGVRGTTFTVATLPTGDALITCTSGKVECGDDAAGKSLVAQPGKVVEKAGGGGMRRLDVPAETADDYLENWYDEKVRLLKSDALAEIKKFVGEYEKRIDQFTTAYDNMMKETTIINKWKAEDRKGKIGSTMEILKEKKIIIGYIYEIQKTLFWFKHVYFRLSQLKRYHDQGFGKGNIRAGYTTTDFFNSFSKADINSRLADLGYIFKLYAKRNEGSVPVASTSDDDFFGDDDF